MAALVLAALAAGTAGAGRADVSAAQYRSFLNTYCRSLTPKLQAAEKGMAAAEKANDLKSYFTFLGEDLGYGRMELQAIVSTQVPAPLQGRMAVARRTAEQLDGLILDTATLFANAKTMTKTQFTSKLTALEAKINRLNTPFNRELDAAGLQDCGSKQP